MSGPFNNSDSCFMGLTEHSDVLNWWDQGRCMFNADQHRIPLTLNSESWILCLDHETYLSNLGQITFIWLWYKIHHGIAQSRILWLSRKISQRLHPYSNKMHQHILHNVTEVYVSISIMHYPWWILRIQTIYQQRYIIMARVTDSFN